MDFLVNNQLYSDLILIIGNKKIFAHKNILHGRSPYFRAMFESGMTEAAKPELVINTEHPPEVWVDLLRVRFRFPSALSCLLFLLCLNA